MRVLFRSDLPRLADAKLEPHRLALRQFAQTPNEVDELDGRAERRVTRRRDAVAAHRDTAGHGDFGRYFFGGQNAALAGFRALAVLELTHLVLLIGRALCREGVCNYVWVSG